MPKPKSIYPLKAIFSSLLVDTDTDAFLIPTYQRGYKWVASGGKGQVDILLRDLFNAYKSRNSRYYLQFLTLKQKNRELEVIDGQQRLTTLSIMFCVIFHILDKTPSDNFVLSKLKYQTRHNFIEEYIYSDIKKLLDTTDWLEFKKAHPSHDNQDVYFIYNAVKAIHQTLLQNGQEIAQFLDYISNSVYLIVNLLENNLNSEKVFVNVNKGVKLNDEDLVKGLLITKLPLDLLDQKHRATEVEINELRTNLGRQWDDLSNWAYRSDIRIFFNSETDGKNRLDWLIRLTFPEIGDDSSGHAMFSYFDRLYTHDKVPAEEIFSAIRKTKMMLNDWFNEAETSNLLGFILSSNDSPGKTVLWKELSQKTTKDELLQCLKSWCCKQLPLDKEYKLRELNYDDNRKELFNVFLMLDVMKFLPIGNRQASNYDFTKISQGSWSIEHIFPQNSKDFKSLDNLSSNDLTIIKELIGSNVEAMKADQPESDSKIILLQAKLINSTNNLELDEDDRETLVGLLKYSAPELHSIGNLALLLNNMNSSLSNHFFDKKREVLVRKISEGEFVPYHTYDVFSKLIMSSSNNILVWTKKDITEHASYVKGQVKKIVEYLNS